MEQLCRTYTRQLCIAETTLAGRPAGAASCVAVDEMSSSDDATTAGEPTDGVEEETQMKRMAWPAMG